MNEKIRVHEKALAHLSRGLYRSPASAIRELVSNAWDANATDVRIVTGAPYFTQLSVRDNGEGFTKEQFVTLMSGGIGNSEKRVSPTPLKFGRPTIGRLGIGMLGIAQICGRFTLTSKTADGDTFSARIILYDLMRQKLDQDDPNVVTEVTVSEGDDDRAVLEVNVGEYELLEIDADETAIGTSIVSDDVHPAFVQSFRETFIRPPKSWSGFLKKSASLGSMQENGDYWRFLWELSALCPVPYMDANALPDGLIKKDHADLIKYNFRLLVDGYDVRKPVNLSGNKAGYTTRKLERVHDRVFSKNVQYHGYIIVQEGTQIKPAELRGILIRIKQIGVGGYDNSLLDFGSNEGPRSRWITGEVFVEQGLEDALNVDRDSFNRFHPEFRLVQRKIHSELRDFVLPSVYKQIDKRTAEKGRERSKTHRIHFQDVLTDALGTDVRLSVQSIAATERGGGEAIIKARGNNLEVSLAAPDSIKTKKSHRELASSVLGAYDISARERTSERRRTVFERLLLELLARW